MAIGGALRAALRAGRFSVAGRESRRQSRALRSLNERGGIGAERRVPLEERGFERMSGLGYGETPRGNAVVVDPATGRRTVMPQSFDDFIEARPMARGPIEAPYEGMRTWNDGVFGNAFGPISFGSPPAWAGRGTPPPSRSFRFFEDPDSELPRFGPAPRDLEGVETVEGLVPYGAGMSGAANRNFMNWNIPRAFGGTNVFSSFDRAPRPSAAGPRFFFDDFA